VSASRRFFKAMIPLSYDSAGVEGGGGTPPALNSATGVGDGAYDVDVVVVKSCFNGLAIYKGDMYYTASCSYADATTVRPSVFTSIDVDACVTLCTSAVLVRVLVTCQLPCVQATSFLITHTC
jgi:hypothetical protein